MWEQLINIGKSAAAFLQIGKAPPNSPPDLKKALEDTNHMASKKFFVAAVSLVALLVFHAVSVFVLFLMVPFPVIISPYVTLFSKTIEIIGVIVAFYLTGQAAVDLRYSSSSNSSTDGYIANEFKTEIVRAPKSKHFDDGEGDLDHD